MRSDRAKDGDECVDTGEWVRMQAKSGELDDTYHAGRSNKAVDERGAKNVPWVERPCSKVSTTVRSRS